MDTPDHSQVKGVLVGEGARAMPAAFKGTVGNVPWLFLLSLAYLDTKKCDGKRGNKFD